MKMVENVVLVILCLICFAYIGETVISFNPFSIKLLAWDKLLGFILLILSLGFFKFYNTRISYYDGYLSGYSKAVEEQTTKINVYKNEDFKMYLYHGNTKEVRETIEEIGILPLSSSVEGNFILVAGNRYSIIDNIDESIPELYDCSDSLDLFLEKCKKSQK